MTNLFPLLIDPELVHPAKEHESNMAYLGRLCLLASYTKLYAGPHTKNHIDSFLIWLATDREGSRKLFSQVGPSEPLSIFSPLSRVKNTSNWTPGTPLDVASCEYTPLFGAAENASDLQSDLNTVDVRNVAIITDEVCWPRKTGSVVCKDEQLRYVHCQQGQQMHWRLSLIIEASTAGSCRSFGMYAQRAFPNLVFSDEAIRSIERIKAGPESDAHIAIAHLSTLNDHAPSIWKEYPLRDDRIARMSALSVDCSPESKNTHGCSSKMRQRDYEFCGTPMRCEWHTKLHHDQGRIHFLVKDEKVLIGAYEKDHLET